MYFLRRQDSFEECFVGNSRMGAGRIGFSVVATDVGGGTNSWDARVAIS